MTVLPAGDARTLARGIIAIATIVAIGKGAPALRRLEGERIAQAAEAAREMASLRTMLSKQPGIHDSIAERTRRLRSVGGGLLRSTSAQLAGAQLATELARLAVRSGARVNSTIIRPDSVFTRDLARVSVRMNLTVDVQGLAEFLESVEDDSRLFAVRELSVSAGDPAALETRAEQLAVEVLVDTLVWRAEGGTPPKGPRP